MASLYSYEYQPQEKKNSEDEVDNDEINFVTEHEDNEEEHGVVVNSKMKIKKLPIILETLSETSHSKICTEHSEVVKAKKKKSHIILCTSSESSEDEETIQNEL